MAENNVVDWDIDNNIPASDPRSPLNPTFFCPRGIKTLEDHRRQFLTHRWVTDMGVVCMDVGEAIKYDERRQRDY